MQSYFKCMMLKEQLFDVTYYKAEITWTPSHKHSANEHNEIHVITRVYVVIAIAHAAMWITCLSVQPCSELELAEVSSNQQKVDNNAKSAIGSYCNRKHRDNNTRSAQAYRLRVRMEVANCYVLLLTIQSYTVLRKKAATSLSVDC